MKNHTFYQPIKLYFHIRNQPSKDAQSILNT